MQTKVVLTVDMEPSISGAFIDLMANPPLDIMPHETRVGMATYAALSDQLGMSQLIRGGRDSHAAS